MEVLEVPPEGIASSDHLEEEEDSQQEEDSQEVSEEIKNNDEQIVQMIPSLLLREHEQYDEHSAGNVDVISSSVEEGALPQSFRKVSYESKEMKRLVALHDPQEKLPVGLNDVNYYQNLVFPDWILSNPLWKNAPKHNENFNEISEILKVPVSKRTQEQISTLIHWLMSVWAVANTMGFKRCGAMFKEFKYQTFEENEKVIVEGERGLTFYIIISGNAVVHKEGIGIVGQLGKAKSFGEIALTQGKDLRTATIIAATKLEVLSLHKLDYDYFVRDIQEMEKRENFQILANCKLFQSWPKGKIEKICNTCLRKTFEAGQYIFRQGDAPEDLCVVVEGTVSIVKELVILSKNRWPTAKHEWEERVLKHTKPIQLKTLQRGDFFGEVAILKNIPRSTSAVATTRSVLISLDKLEFLHLVNMGGGASSMLEEADGELSKAIKKYVVDEDLIAAIGEIKGGPGSAAILGDMTLNKAELEYQTRIMEGFSSRPMSPSTSRPRSPSRPRSRGRTSPPSNRSRANSDHNKGNGKTMRERLEKLSKQDSIAESILNMADEKKKVDERIR